MLIHQRLVYFNGKYIPECEARISIFDCALMYGDMVFEMTRSFEQKPFQLRNHLERLYASSMNKIPPNASFNFAIVLIAV